MSLQNTLVKLEIFHNLLREWVSPEHMPALLWVHRATVYRWMRSHRQKGIRQFKKDYTSAKKGRRCRVKTSGYVRGLVKEIRRKYRECCGEKIAFFLKRDYGIVLAQSTIYRILHSEMKLPKRWKRHPWGGEMPRGISPEDVIQVDTVMFGGLYAFTAVDTFTRRVHVEMSTSLTSEDGKRFVARLLQRFPGTRLLQRDGWSEFKGVCDTYIRQRGIHVRTSRPYKKNEQCFIERFNGILRKECLWHTKYALKDLSFVEKRLHSFLSYYHSERPHLSLKLLTPNAFTAQWEQGQT